MAEYGRIHTDGSRSGGQPVLLPCPFCGETPTLQWHSAPECWVECSCGAIGPQGEDTSTDDHIALWNTRQPTQSDALQADIDAMESILWVDTIIDDKEAIAKAFARHRQYGYDQGYYEGCANPIVRYDALRDALQHCADAIASWKKKPEGADPWLLGALDNALKVLEQSK